MLATLLSLSLALAPSQQDYVMAVAGVPVGRVRLGVSEAEDGFSLTYESESLVRRGPVLSRNISTVHASLTKALGIRRLNSVRQEGGVLARSVSGRASGSSISFTVVQPGGKLSTTRAASSAVPSALAALLLDGAEARCIDVLEETSGRAGKACGARVGGEIQGTLLGEKFVATLDGERMTRLEFPAQLTTFTAVDAVPALFPPPDLFGSGVATEGLSPSPGGALALRLTVPSTETLELPESPSQQLRKVPNGLEVAWSPAEPGVVVPLPPLEAESGALGKAAVEARGSATDTWAAARAVAHYVSERITDKRPASGERSADWVFESRRASCVGHTELFLALAGRAGLTVRRAIGLVAADGRFWAHSWAQVKVGTRWFDVDPTDGSAPAAAPRILFAAVRDGDEAAAGRLLALSRLMRVAVVR